MSYRCAGQQPGRKKIHISQSKHATCKMPVRNMQCPLVHKQYGCTQADTYLSTEFLTAFWVVSTLVHLEVTLGLLSALGELKSKRSPADSQQQQRQRRRIAVSSMFCKLPAPTSAEFASQMLQLKSICKKFCWWKMASLKGCPQLAPGARATNQLNPKLQLHGLCMHGFHHMEATRTTL